MSQYTVEQFASELKLPVDLLLDQLKKAGVKKNNFSDELLDVIKIDEEKAKELIMTARAPWFTE